MELWARERNEISLEISAFIVNSNNGKTEGDQIYSTPKGLVLYYKSYKYCKNNTDEIPVKFNLYIFHC